MTEFIRAGGYGKTPMLGIGIDERRWLKPVRPGDRLVVEREVVEVARSASRPDRGTVRTRVVVRNEAGEPMLSRYSIGRVPARPSRRDGGGMTLKVDVERARRELPGGMTIAHGLLTLSLIPRAG
ncbi:MAG TPA: hypothetical protein VML91_14060 [Burkholderiales bacterium]|nr:hypothetical protein [Burkholderiales bacterium]